MSKIKSKVEVGSSCSICGHKPAIKVDGTYWLCGACAKLAIDDKSERIETLEGDRNEFAYQVLVMMVNQQNAFND